MTGQTGPQWTQRRAGWIAFWVIVGLLVLDLVVSHA